MPCAPVAAFAFPELITTACGCARSRCSLLTTTGAAWTRLAVNIPAPTQSPLPTTSARSGPSLLMRAATPLAVKPLAAVTLIRALR